MGGRLIHGIDLYMGKYGTLHFYMIDHGKVRIVFTWLQDGTIKSLLVSAIFWIATKIY